MSGTVTFHCPNCDAGLLFNAEKGNFACEFCLSEFTKEELDETASAKKSEEEGQKNEEYSSHLHAYHCQNCGAEVVCEEHTSATFCYYCHNPVVLLGEVSGELLPKKIIPFKFDREGAVEHFLTFAKKHKFVPDDYRDEKQLEKITGVYFPFWVTDADVSANYRTTAKRSRSWRQGDYIYTEVSHYNISRAGNIHFEDVVSSALTTEDSAMLEGIMPYPQGAHIDFDMAYLLGYFAKRRNAEKEAFYTSVRDKMTQGSTTLFRSTISGYSTIDSGECDLTVQKSDWSYTLMPVWMMTYKDKKGKTYLYAMNGYTGKIYGELPISWPKLLLLCGGVFLSIFLVIFLLMIGGIL